MSINVNDLSNEEKYFFLKLSYIDLKNSPDYLSSKKSIIGILNDASKIRGISKEKIIEIHKLKEDYDKLSKINNKLNQIRIVGYENHNPIGNTTHDDKTGFVGYVFEDDKGNRGFLFRGTEDLKIISGASENIDMNDNYSSALSGTSTQIEQAIDFFNRNNAEGKINSLYGHSKGNNLAAEVFLANLDMDIYAYGVNGQPAYWYDLTDEQKAALRGDRYTFNVHQFDLVNMLGYVDYVDKVIGLKDVTRIKEDPFYPHLLSSVEFNDDGNFISFQTPNTIGRQVINLILSEIHELEQLTHLLKDPYGVIGSMGKDGFYFIIDTVKVILKFVWQKANNSAFLMKDKCIEYFSKLEMWSKEKIDRLSKWLNQVINRAEVYFNQQLDDIQGMYVPNEPYLSVNTGRLIYYSQKLAYLQRQILDIDKRLQSLYFRIGLFELGHLVKADLLTGCNYRLTQSINYLNKSAEFLENTEIRLIRQVNSL